MSGEFIIKPTTKDFAKLGLSANPFRASPVPEDAPRIFADQDRAKELIRKLISDVVYGGEKPIHTMIIGGYGNGKSHTLKIIRTSVFEQLYTDNLAIAGYAPRTGENFLSLYQGSMKDLGIGFFEDLGMKVRRRLEESGELPSRAQISSREIDGKSVTLLYKKLGDLDLATAIVRMFYPNTYSFRIAVKWICGEWVNLFTLRDIGIIKRIDSDEKALSTFINFRKLMESIGIKMIFLCIDEFEDIIQMNADQRTSLLGSIRHLIDWNPSGMTLIVSCSPEALDRVIAYPPLDRIALQIRLEDLSEENACVYVEAYLNRYRIDKTKDPLFPFSSDIVRKIFQLLERRAKANVRNLLKLCYFAIDTALDMKKDKVDDDVVDQLDKMPEIYLG